MIPNERLKCFVQGIDLENIKAQDEIDMATELLFLREQKRRLIEDAKALYVVCMTHAIKPGKDVWSCLYYYKQHETLMEELDA